MKIITNNYFKVFVFFLIYIYIFIINNLFYTSTYSADYQKYVVYLEYFYGFINYTNLDQGSLYYSLVAITLNFFSQFTSPTTLQFDISFSIQFTNNLLILFGLLGVYKLLNQLEIKFNNSILILIIVNFFPPLQSLKLAMKPEILIFSLLPWLIFLLKNYLDDENHISLIVAIIPTVLIGLSKGTGFAITSLFLLYVFFEILIKLNLKQFLGIFVIFVIFLTPIMYENYEVNNTHFLTRNDITENYKNRASLDILLKNDRGKTFQTPFGEIDISTVFGVTLLDTFDDHFLLDWNKDVSLFKKHRKDLLIPYDGEQILSIDLNNREIQYNGIFKNSIINLRVYLGIILTFIFYILLFRFRHEKKINKKIVRSPILGIFILYFHSLGIPQEDFDPLVADTFKTFYYSPFLVISFIFILSKLLDNINRQTIVITIIFIFSTLHINGFPKKDSSEYYGFLDELNQNNVLCEINSLIIFDIKNSSKCTNKVDELCKFYTNKEEFELETSKFLIVDNVSYVKDEFQTVNQCINKINRVSQLETARLPIYNLSIFFMFILINLYTVLRPNNFPSRIWLSNN
tara:strand:+ start:6530 stop:8251 length:1722 start_codon:yes stop_codon:yes gene_type:complete